MNVFDGMFLQSSHPRRRVITARVNSRTPIATVTKVKHIQCCIMSSFVWSGGLIKFGITPGGGKPAGISCRSICTVMAGVDIATLGNTVLTQIAILEYTDSQNLEDDRERRSQPAPDRAICFYKRRIARNREP